MAEAQKINDELYVLPLGDGNVQLRILVQEDETTEEWKCINLSRQDAYKLMSFLRNDVLYLC